MEEQQKNTKRNKSRKDRDVYELVKEADQAKKKARSQKTRRSLGQLLVYYALPLLSIVIFFGIIIFGTVPAVSGINNFNNEIEEKNEEIEKLDKEIASLQDLREKEFEMRNDLEIIDRIVPAEKSQVAKFVGEIADLADEYELDESQYTSGEQVESLEEEEQEEEIERETASIINIPADSSYQAPFSNISQFLNALYNKDDFIIVSQLDMLGFLARELQAEQDENAPVQNVTIPKDDWTMDVTFEKYQFSESFSEYVENNLVSIRTEPDEKTLEFIRLRYAN